MSKRIEYHGDLTPKEIGALHDAVLSFEGKSADLDQIRRFEKLRQSVWDFNDSCEYASGVLDIPPDSKKRHAIVCVDLKLHNLLSKEDFRRLNALVRDADRTTCSGCENCIRYTFTIKDCWRD